MVTRLVSTVRDSSSKILLVIIVLTVTLSANGARLNKNGGYDLLISVDENSARPPNPVLYFNKIQLVTQSFSNAMYFVTNKTFFINSVELLLPNTWNMPLYSATTQSFEGADVKVSDKFQYLRAENPNLCGQPGQFIETPLDLFENSGYTSKYGTPWRALFTQWARYRWGIWEEHGYPGDHRFPYFYRKAGADGWSLTGCSDIALDGEYRTIENKTCRADEEAYPGDDCRFHPDREHNLAKSSIMHFHWIESVDQLCNETNHDREAPNRQNRNCGHRSAWEVLRETPDYKYATDPRPIFIPTLQMVVVQKSPLPRLLILLDKGTSRVTDAIRLSVQASLSELFRAGKISAEAVAKISNFPAQNITEDPSPIVSTQVEWDYVENNAPFLNALSSTKSNNTVREDFGLAILSAINDCKQMNHPAGCLLIVVKTGAAKSAFGALTYEQDVLASLKEDPRVKLIAVEVLADSNEAAHLKNLASQSAATYVQIIRAADVEGRLKPVVEEIANLFAAGKITFQTNNFRQVYRGAISSNKVQDVPIIADSIVTLDFQITSRSKLNASSIHLEPLGVPNHDRIVLSPSEGTPEWSETFDPTRRYLYSLRVTDRALVRSKLWRVYFITEVDYTAVLHVNANVNVSSQDASNDTITLVLSTSSNIVDMTDTKFSSSPFNIFLSAHKLGQPVIKLSARATIHSLSSGETWEIPLVDDGRGSPDVYPEDGVYSGSFVPPTTGNYQIFGFLQNSDCTARSNDVKLILPDQGNIGCFPSNKNFDEANSACTGTVIEGNYARVVASPGVTHVQKSSSSAIGKPFRTLDLQGLIDEINGFVTLSFVSPRLLGSNESASSYEIYYSPNMNDLIESLDSSLKLGYIPANPPGTVEVITIKAGSTQVIYYAIQTIYSNQRSDPSNIIALKSTVTSLDGKTRIVGLETSKLSIMEQPTNNQSIWNRGETVVTAMIVYAVLVAVVAFGMVEHSRRKLKQNARATISIGSEHKCVV